jgi:hypothetical protein
VHSCFAETLSCITVEVSTRNICIFAFALSTHTHTHISSTCDSSQRKTSIPSNITRFLDTMSAHDSSNTSNSTASGEMSTTPAEDSGKTSTSGASGEISKTMEHYFRTLNKLRALNRAAVMDGALKNRLYRLKQVEIRSLIRQLRENNGMPTRAPYCISCTCGCSMVSLRELVIAMTDLGCKCF